MSTETLKVEEKDEFEKNALNGNNQIEESFQKNDLEKNNFIPFTKKWRVKLYILNSNGEWDDRGIGYVFLANEVEEQNIEGCSDSTAPTQMVKKLIMLRENTK